MTGTQHTTRRTVLKTLGAGVAGGTLFSGTAAGHGGDPRFPVWFETNLFELAGYPPEGEEPTDPHSHAPIWHIKAGADGQPCGQVPTSLFPQMVFNEFLGDNMDPGDWQVGAGFRFDHVASANPFSTLWHIHWVFDSDAFEKNNQDELVPKGPLMPDDLVNEADIGGGRGTKPLTSGSRIRDAADEGNIVVVEADWVFNCPIRPNHGHHYLPCQQ